MARMKRIRSRVVQIELEHEAEEIVENIKVDDAEDINESSVERKKCGYTRMNDVWNLLPGQRIKVKVGKNKQPLGQAAGVLGDYLGTIARHPDMAPINLNWKAISKDTKDTMIGVVEKICDKNKMNSSKLKIRHTLGKTSYAKFIDHLEADLGRGLSIDEIFTRAHLRKSDKIPVNEETTEVIEKMKTVKHCYPELAEPNVPVQEDIVSIVLGKEKSGYVRCYSIGPSPRNFATRRMTNVEIERESAKDETIRQLKEQVKNMATRMEKLEQLVEVSQNGL